MIVIYTNNLYLERQISFGFSTPDTLCCSGQTGLGYYICINYRYRISGHNYRSCLPLPPSYPSNQDPNPAKSQNHSLCACRDVHIIIYINLTKLVSCIIDRGLFKYLYVCTEKCVHQYFHSSTCTIGGEAKWKVMNLLIFVPLT